MTDPILDQEPKLAEIVRRLAVAYQPERIYLFGSVARGEKGPDSDYDLLVVVPTTHPWSGGMVVWRTARCGAWELL